MHFARQLVIYAWCLWFHLAFIYLALVRWCLCACCGQCSAKLVFLGITLLVQGNLSFEADVVFACNVTLVSGRQPGKNFPGVSDWTLRHTGYMKHEKRVCGNVKNKLLAQVIM